MKEKIQKVLIIIFSGLFLAVSIGMIVWMVQDEGRRLAVREQAALEKARVETEAAEKAERGNHESVEGKQEAERAFRDIDTLLISIEGIGLPEVQ